MSGGLVLRANAGRKANRRMDFFRFGLKAGYSASTATV